MPRYISAQYGDQRRYLLKGLREIAHRIEELVSGLDERTLSTRPNEIDPTADEEWCVKEIVAFLRDSEREDLRALEAMLRIDGAPIGSRRGDSAVADGAYRDADAADLLWDFAMLRDETSWLLQSAGSAWNHVGTHPFRGEVSVLDWVQEMNERDLDAMWRIQRAYDALRPPGRPRVTGRAEP